MLKHIINDELVDCVHQVSILSQYIKMNFILISFSQMVGIYWYCMYMILYAHEGKYFNTNIIQYRIHSNDFNAIKTHTIKQMIVKKIRFYAI